MTATAAAPDRAEARLAAFLELVDGDTINGAFCALSPHRRLELLEALSARHAQRLVDTGVGPELVAATRPDRHTLDRIASSMVEHRDVWDAPTEADRRDFLAEHRGAS